MSGADMEHELPEGGDEGLAAEYALGALSPEEQAVLARRVDTDPQFAARVAQWEERLIPLAEGFPAADLSPAVKRALDLRLFGKAVHRAAQRGFWASLALWRAIAGAATAACLALLVMTPQPITQASDRLAASLQAEGSSVTYLVLYDSATGSVSLAHMSGDAVVGRDFQLWVAEGAEAPVSLGVIPAGVSTQVAIPDQIRALMTTASHMAISLEPPGGSPTGRPTGPVLAVGDLLNI